VVAGAVFVATGGMGGGLSAAIVSGGASSMASSAADQVLTTGSIDTGEVVTQGVIGAATGGLTHGAGRLAGKVRGCNSFAPGTAVLMADGTSKPIEDVKVGDKVKATDPTTGKTTTQPVTDVITGVGQKNLVQITVDTDGERGHQTGMVVATDGHPFWVDGDLNKWVKAADLKPGMWLRTSAGTYVQITAIKAWTQQQVHNLTVDTDHTYYVEAGNTPVLVHNCGGNAAIDADRLAHIEYRHGPGAQEMAKAAGEEDIPGEFNEEFIWDGDNHVLGDRLIEGANNSPELPNSNGPGHLHIFDSGRTVGVNGAGAETTRVEVVVRNGRIWTAYPH
jgi:hypothetical protein